MGAHLEQCRVAVAVAVITWLRSVNASNSNNFCNVNTDGTANNNNANNSLGCAPDLTSLPQGGWVAKVTRRGEEKTLRERRCVSRGLVKRLKIAL